MSVAAILLAGGQGIRFQATTPKQYIEVNNQPLCLYSYYKLLESDLITTLVVVADPSYHHLFDKNRSKPIFFAQPGSRRQDSLANGLNAIAEINTNYYLVHDAARPFLSNQLIADLVTAAENTGAAAPALPIHATVRHIEGSNYTPRCRKGLHKIQTPQVVKADWLIKGLEHSTKENLEVTDELSLLEHLDLPYTLIPGDPRNIKVTNPLDLTLIQPHL